MARFKIHHQLEFQSCYTSARRVSCITNFQASGVGKPDVGYSTAARRPFGIKQTIRAPLPPLISIKRPTLPLNSLLPSPTILDINNHPPSTHKNSNSFNPPKNHALHYLRLPRRSRKRERLPNMRSPSPGRYLLYPYLVELPLTYFPVI